MSRYFFVLKFLIFLKLFYFRAGSLIPFRFSEILKRIFLKSLKNSFRLALQRFDQLLVFINVSF